MAAALKQRSSTRPAPAKAESLSHRLEPRALRRVTINERPRSDIMKACDTFGNAAKEHALQVVLKTASREAKLA